ncbi:hypothetical protein ACP4OV_024482 [Aristida adscensionis]
MTTLEVAAASLGNVGIEVFAYGLMLNRGARRVPAVQLGRRVQASAGSSASAGGSSSSCSSHRHVPGVLADVEGFSGEAFSGLPEFFRLSAASAVMLCLETWYTQITVLIAGKGSRSET